MRAFLLCGLVATLTGIALVACNPNSIGRPCVNPEKSVITGVQLVSPALECPSRLCLLTGNTTGITVASDGGTTSTRQVCTDFCSSDDDCAAETYQYCTSGFKCAVADTINSSVNGGGTLACRNVCICKDDLVIGTNALQNADGGIEVVKPCACGATPAQNPTCSATNTTK